MQKKFLPVVELAKAGINTDLLPWDLGPDFLTNINNVRVIRGRLGPAGGKEKWVDLPEDFEPGFIMHLKASAGNYWIIAGRPDSVGDYIYVFDGTTFTGVGGAYTSGDPDLWNGCLLSDVPILIHQAGHPYAWFPQSTANPFTVLPWATNGSTDPADWTLWDDPTVDQRARIIRSHKQFLIALYLNDAGDEISDGVRWSSPADIQAIPETWDPLDTTNVAGFTRLGGPGGPIVDGFSLRDSFAIYRENGITMMDFVGGQFIWQFRHLSTTHGCISRDSVVEVKGVHFFIGDGDIFVNDGNTIKSLLHNRLRKRFVSNYSPDNFRRAFAVKNNALAEVWFCIPSANAEYPDIAYVYNWEDDSWAIRDLFEHKFANYGPQVSTQEKWNTIDPIIDWRNVNRPWGQDQLTPLDDTIVAIERNAPVRGSLQFIDKVVSFDTAGYRSVIERIGFALEGLQNVTTITSVYPHASGPGEFYVRLGSQDHPGSSIRWKPPVLFRPGIDRKVDIRTTGELHCYQIYNDNVDASWEVSGIDIEYVNAGMR